MSVPETASWLTEREKKFIQARLPANAPRASEENFNFHEILQSLKDIRLWLFMLIWATFTVGTNGVTFYQSTVIADLGFTYVGIHLTSERHKLTISQNHCRSPAPQYPHYSHRAPFHCDHRYHG